MILKISFCSDKNNDNIDNENHDKRIDAMKRQGLLEFRTRVRGNLIGIPLSCSLFSSLLFHSVFFF